MNSALHLQQRIPFSKNTLFQSMTFLFVVFWVYYFMTTRSQTNWWIENILVMLFVPWFISLQKKFLFSDLSLLCIFLFLMVHIYGAQMSYTYNQLGVWLQHKLQLQRNPYDRFVHFCFGLFIVYPMQDYLINKIKTPVRWSYVLSVITILALATIFELIEWMVAACTDTETGESYVASQGDVWDAHKDIALALLASVLVMGVLIYRKKLTQKNQYES